MAQHWDEVRAMGRLRDAFDRLELDVILQRRAEMHDEDLEVLVADNIPLEVWNRFAQMKILPHNLHLWQLLWAADKVWIVGIPVTRAHELVNSFCVTRFDRAIGGNISQTGRVSLIAANQPTFEADFTLGPSSPHAPGFQVPPNTTFGDWVTVIVEILHSQEWSSGSTCTDNAQVSSTLSASRCPHNWSAGRMRVTT